MQVGAIYVLVGKRDIGHFVTSVRLLRRACPNVPVLAYYDGTPSDISQLVGGIEVRQFERVKFPHREEVRNSDLCRLRALLSSPFEVTVYLDNDIYVVHAGFAEGFRMASEFGLAMPINPRSFVATYEGTLGDLDIGEDVTSYDREFLKDMPKYSTSYNSGLMFFAFKSKELVSAWLDELLAVPSRGQAALYRAVWRTHLFPYILAANWLVCDEDRFTDFPITVHAGHPRVVQVVRKRCLLELEEQT
jgi:hypothetical protein